MMLPVSTTSTRRMLSAASRSLAASVRRSLARALGSSAAQAGCAASAAATARLTSAAVPAGTWPSVSSLAGLTDSSHSPASLATSSPPINIWPRMRLEWTFMRQSSCVLCALQSGRLEQAAFLKSIGPDVRIVHHLGPFGDLGLDPLAEMLRRIRDRLEAQIQQPLPDLGQCDHARDLAVPALDDR